MCKEYVNKYCYKTLSSPYILSSISDSKTDKDSAIQKGEFFTSLFFKILILHNYSSLYIKIGVHYLPIELMKTLVTVLKCPKCGSDMVVRQKKNNPEELYIGCLSYPNCKNAVWLPSIVKTLQVLPDTCSAVSNYSYYFYM